MVNSVIAYPGAKLRFYPHMREYFPEDMKVFIEPFFGGGSVSLNVAVDSRFSKVERIIGGDLYSEVWAMWNGVKKHPNEVIEIASKWFTIECPHQKEINQLGFYGNEARKYLEGGDLENYKQSDILTDNEKKEIEEKLKLYNIVCEEAKKFWDWSQTVDTSEMTLAERAARFLLVNKISFSAMGDSGSLSKDQFCEFRLGKLDNVHTVSKIMNERNIEVNNVSFEETMKYASNDGAFVFLDPPYLKQEASGLYGKNGGTHKGFPHELFAEETKKLPCKWFVTYDDSVAVRKLFSGKTVDGGEIFITPFTIPGGYTMAGKTAEDALKGEEVFITNYDLDDDEPEEF